MQKMKFFANFSTLRLANFGTVYEFPTPIFCINIRWVKTLPENTEFVVLEWEQCDLFGPT